MKLIRRPFAGVPCFRIRIASAACTAVVTDRPRSLAAAMICLLTSFEKRLTTRCGFRGVVTGRASRSDMSSGPVRNNASSASAALFVSGVMPRGMLAASSNGGGRLDASEPSIAGEGLPSASRVRKTHGADEPSPVHLYASELCGRVTPEKLAGNEE